MATSPMSNNSGKMPRCIMEKEFERKRAYDIMRRMDAEHFSLSVCEWGAKGFASIAGLAMTNQNAESLADFLDDGGCESLVQIMNKYAETSVIVAAYGCLTASILAWSLRELKEFLGEIGAGEIIVFATSMHIGDPLVSEFGTRAIGLLAKQNIANSYRLAQAGACDALAQAGNFGFNLRHAHAVDVAGNVCVAFSELAEAVNATRLMECGASALVVELTKYHHKHDEFARSAMRAICALASLNAQHREELGRCDVCPLVVKMLYVHVNISSLLLEGCEAIMHLSLSPNNANRLGASGGCEVVCHLLQNKLQEVDFGAEVCTGAMLNLALYGEDAHRNRLKLVQANVIDLLRKTQFSPRASYKARENVLTLLDLLATEMGNTTGELQSSNHLTGSYPHMSSSSQDVYNSNSAGPVNPYHYQQHNANQANHSAISHHPHNHHNSNNNNSNEKDKLVSIIHGSEMKGDTVPLKVEVREIVEYSSFVPFSQHSPQPKQRKQRTTSTGSAPGHQKQHSQVLLHHRHSPSPDVVDSDPFVKTPTAVDDEDEHTLSSAAITATTSATCKGSTSTATISEDNRESFSDPIDATNAAINQAATAIMNTIFTNNNRTNQQQNTNNYQQDVLPYQKHPATVVEL